MRSAKRIGVIVGCIMLLCAGGARAQDWPQWRGPNRDNKVTGFTAPKAWPDSLTQKWKVNVGLGDASPVLVGDKVYVFTRQGGDEVTLCLDSADGHEIWRDKYATQAVTGAPGQHPGTRGSPAVAEGKVCTLGVAGVLSCLDADKGAVAWRKDSKEFSKPYPKFYMASSPIIVDGKCIAHLGTNGDGAIVAYDLNSGEQKWKWAGEGPGYASPVVMTVEGVKQVVTLTDQSVVGVGAADGALLWKVPFAAKGMGGVNSVTPIVDGQTVIYAGQDAGTTAVKIEKQGDGFVAKQMWKKDQSPGRFTTPVLKDGVLYGLASAGRGAANFYCMKADTGDVLWTDTAKRGECGAILDAGDVLLALTSDEQLVAFKPSDKEFTQLAKIKVADSPTWAEPIIAGNRVFVKDKDSLTLWAME